MNNLPLPIRKQREVLYMPTRGHSVILGTAGSGKTTLALYRAAFLSTDGLAHSGHTLLLTYNNALVNYLTSISSSEELQNVQIETYHKFARGYLSFRNKMQVNCILDERDKNNLFMESIDEIQKLYPMHPLFKMTKKFLKDEMVWVQSHGLQKSEYCNGEYNQDETPLPKEHRHIMCLIIQEYLKKRTEFGKKYDWDDLAFFVRKELESDNSERMYRHIVIDEGQDFSSEMLRSLINAVPPDGSLTLFGDVTQQIYIQRTSWRSAGLNITEKEIWKFEENYRNTRQIAALGMAISQMPYFQGIPDIVMPTFQQNDGPKPVLAKYASDEKQIKECARIAIDSSKNKTVAILFPNHALKKRIGRHLMGSGVIELKDNSYEIGDTGLFYGTYHSSKGLEFDQVLLPFLDSDIFPDKDEIKAHGETYAQTYSARLLYVAATRARTELALLYSGNITPLLPPDNTLYQWITDE